MPAGRRRDWDYPGGLKTSDIITIPMRRANSKLPGAVEGRLYFPLEAVRDSDDNPRKQKTGWVQELTP